MKQIRQPIVALLVAGLMLSVDVSAEDAETISYDGGKYILIAQDSSSYLGESAYERTYRHTDDDPQGRRRILTIIETETDQDALALAKSRELQINTRFKVMAEVVAPKSGITEMRFLSSTEDGELSVILLSMFGEGYGVGYEAHVSRFRKHPSLEGVQIVDWGLICPDDKKDPDVAGECIDHYLQEKDAMEAAVFAMEAPVFCRAPGEELAGLGERCTQ